MIPLRPFFAVTSVLLYYMAFVFMGKGIRELQEGNLVSITVIPGFPHVGIPRIVPERSRDCWLSSSLLLLFVVRGGEDVLAEAVGDAADDAGGSDRGGARRSAAGGDARGPGRHAGAHQGTRSRARARIARDVELTR